MYIKNNRGPKTEPRGTPNFIDYKSRLTPFIITNCFRFDRFKLVISNPSDSIGFF